MTREEALKFWEWRYENAKDYYDDHWEADERRSHREYVEALEWAVKTLADRKTENCSEKPNNCEPQITMDCSKCRLFTDGGEECDLCALGIIDEPQTDIHDFTDCDFCTDKNCKDCEGGKDEPQTETEIAKAIVHKMIDDAVIAEDAYPDLRQKMHDAVDEYEPQTDCGIGCSRCEGRFECIDRDMPHAVHCNNYGKITDEPQTDCAWK